jgi:hypothetical protein
VTAQVLASRRGRPSAALLGLAGVAGAQTKQVPDVRGQLRLIHDRVLPALAEDAA